MKENISQLISSYRETLGKAGGKKLALLMSTVGFALAGCTEGVTRSVKPEVPAVPQVSPQMSTSEFPEFIVPTGAPLGISESTTAVRSETPAMSTPDRTGDATPQAPQPVPEPERVPRPGN